MGAALALALPQWLVRDLQDPRNGRQMQHMTIRISESPVRAASFLKAHTTFLVSDPDRVVLTSHEREMNETKGHQSECWILELEGKH
jgi:hypothetical protein